MNRKYAGTLINDLIKLADAEAGKAAGASAGEKLAFYYPNPAEEAGVDEYEESVDREAEDRAEREG